LSVVSNFGVKPCFLRSLRITGVQPACRVGAEPACREPRPHDRRRATGTCVCRLSGPPSRRGAIDRSAVADTAAGFVRSGAEFQNPAPHRFIGNLQAALGQEILHIATAQGEAQVEPDRVLDDPRREAMATIGEMGHVRTLTDRPVPGEPVAVTTPRAGARAAAVRTFAMLRSSVRRRGRQ